jgi:KDO2-lipid IV(A) lauroyltransferase
MVRRLPEPVAMSLGAAGGLLYYRLDQRRREALRANLRQVLGPASSDARVERVVRRGFSLYGRYWAEAFRLEDLSPDDIRDRWSIQGREHLDAALALGRGAIFATPHIGNWDAGATWLATEGYQVTTIVERLKPIELFDRFVTYRRALGMEILPLDNGSESMRGVLRALRAGRLVALVCDRDLTGHGLRVEMFGAPASLPGGPASLALKTGAALLPCAVLQGPRAGHWTGVVRPAIRLEPTGDQRVDTLALTQRLATEFERLIAATPEQWHVLSRFWREDPGGVAGPPAPATAPTVRVERPRAAGVEGAVPTGPVERPRAAGAEEPSAPAGEAAP